MLAMVGDLTQVVVMNPESGNWSIMCHRDRGVVTQVSWSPDGALIHSDRQTDVPQGIKRPGARWRRASGIGERGFP